MGSRDLYLFLNPNCFYVLNGMRDRCGGYLLFTDTLSPINKFFVFLLFIITGIVRELHGMQNGFRCSDKGEPGDRGEKGDKGERGGPEGVSFFFGLPSYKSGCLIR